LLCILQQVPVRSLIASLEKQIEVAFKNNDATLISTFQRRIGCVRLAKAFLEREREEATATVPARVSEEATYTPAEKAQRVVLGSLKDAGLGLLRVFPVCMATLHEDSQREILIQPVRKLCEGLTRTSDLQFCLT
jgi:hypothetical protein